MVAADVDAAPAIFQHARLRHRFHVGAISAQPVFLLFFRELRPARFANVVQQHVFHLKPPSWILCRNMFRYYNDVWDPAVWTAAHRLFALAVCHITGTGQ